MPKKTPEYTRNAVKRYNDKFDKVLIRLPKGAAEEIKTRTGKSCNQYFNDLYTDDLKRAAPDPEESPPE